MSSLISAKTTDDMEKVPSTQAVGNHVREPVVSDEKSSLMM